MGGRAKVGVSPSTFLEASLPYKKLSLIANADRRARDPVYGVHRWWARRPPGVIRALLLAAALPADVDESEFWRLFRSPGHALHGMRVHDLFIGGGTTVVEAARLGAIPSGTDVDPLAVSIVKHELRRPDSRLVSRAGEALLQFLQEKVGHLFTTKSSGWIPLHYFFLHRVTCPDCLQVSPLYRSLVIARDASKNGGVVRNAGLVAFCPDCFQIHQLASPSRKRLRCCRQYELKASNYAGQRFTCPVCQRRSTHAELQTGTSDRLLLAVEEACDGQRRRIRSPRASDAALIEASAEYVQAHRRELRLPTGSLRVQRTDDRPLSFGIKTPTQFFSDRQLAVFGHAFQWLKSAEHPEDVKAALALAISGALATNNKLCSYATDYGRLAPLFSVRSYSLPALAVELNPFHPSAGRGTLRRSLERVCRSTTSLIRRYVWSERDERPEAAILRFRRNGDGAELRCASAATVVSKQSDADILLFDPPYFDYIAYSELSEFYRVWLDQTRLGGKPLLPNADGPVESYGRLLSKCLKAALRRLKRRRPLAFTFHSADPAAWEAIGFALDRAGLLITALWPVRDDAHMGHHTKEANCEWDLVVICRRTSECRRARPTMSLSRWRGAVVPLKIGTGDEQSMKLAIAMAKTRFGLPTKGRPDEF
jgi:putative DNA methylase